MLFTRIAGLLKHDHMKFCTQVCEWLSSEQLGLGAGRLNHSEKLAYLINLIYVEVVYSPLITSLEQQLTNHPDRMGLTEGQIGTLSTNM